MKKRPGTAKAKAQAKPKKKTATPKKKSSATPLEAALRAALRRVMESNDDRKGALRALSALPIAAPTALRTVYTLLAACSIEPADGPMIDIFDPHELADVHTQQGYRDALPGALFFASDGGDGWYYMDTDGAIGGTPGAVLWGDRGSMSRGSSRRVAGDLAGFLRAAVRGKLFPHVATPSIDDQEDGDLVEFLESKRAAWVAAGPGRSNLQLRVDGVLDRLGCNVDGSLGTVYNVADGITVPGAQAVIWPSDRIERADARDGLPEYPFESSVFPTGFWIGEHRGRRLLYCVGLTKWRRLADETVVAVAAEQAPDDGVVLGNLATVVRGWLR